MTSGVSGKKLDELFESFARSVALTKFLEDMVGAEVVEAFRKELRRYTDALGSPPPTPPR